MLYWIKPFMRGMYAVMEKNKLHIEKNTIQETLIIPLYARKLCTQIFPSIYSNPESVKLIAQLDYDFSALEKKSARLMQRFGALEVAMRQTDLAFEVKEYLKDHPCAAVVNMGCGLDQTGESCDNGTCRIYNIDMPDVIAVRNQMIPPTERVNNIACDLKDTSWFDKIDNSGGSVFFAAGVFYYFETSDVKKLVNHMAEHFSGGKLVFDTAGKTALKMMLKTWIKQAGIKNVDAFFHVDSLEKDVLPWLKHAKVSQRGYMLGYHDLKAPCIPSLFRLLSKIGDNSLRMQILRFDFAQK